MQLNKLIVQTRVRSGWSAIDLGFSLARVFWLRACCVYLIAIMPIYALTLLLDKQHIYLPYLILWWFKPIFERPILYMISRELFSESMSIKRVFSDFWLWFKPSFFWIITWRRLSVYRGMTAPIMLLEQPDSSAYSKRASVLTSKFSSEAMWLTVVLYHIETFIYFAIIGLVALFVPEAAYSLFEGLYSDDVQRNYYADIIYLISITVIAPLYVVAGFMLYISRRVELEGWDIEIIFRNWMTNYREPIDQLELNDDHHLNGVKK